MAKETLERLASVASDQWGMATRQQILAAGISDNTFDRLRAHGTLQPVARGVFSLTTAPAPEHADLKAAWLQLEPAVPAWKRLPESGLVSHRSAAALWGISNFSLDRFDFIVASRKQSRRHDVTLHIRDIDPASWFYIQGMPVTKPASTAADLLSDREDPETVGQFISRALGMSLETPANMAAALAPLARRYGRSPGDGEAMLAWLLDLAGDSRSSEYLVQAKHSE